MRVRKKPYTGNLAGVGLPQRKMISVSEKLGDKSLKNQQGTTRVIYDSIPIDGRSEYRFFEEANTRQFPFTNMSNDGNKMGVGQAMAVERVYLSVVELDNDGDVLTITPLTAALPGIQAGELSISVAQNEVAKQIPVLSFDPRFNKDAASDINHVFEFDTDLTLMPLLEFVFRLRVNGSPAAVNTFLRLTVEGAGSLINTRTTF
jgi:hypothetical protein